MVVGFAVFATARPAQIILLRHAEKPVDDADTGLSSKGRERANALVNFLTTHPVLTNAGPPAFLIAARPTRDRASRRPIETLEPLATKLTLPVQTPFRAKDWQSLAASVLSNPDYDSRNVVICWVHDSIVPLAKALGAKVGSAEWSGDVYDRIWLITFSDGKAKLTTINQALLPGDKGRKRHRSRKRETATGPENN